MRFLFTTIPGSGHFNPMVPTALAFEARGHQVTFAASEAFTPIIEAAGFRNLPTGPSWLENMADPVMREILTKEFFIELTRMGMVEGVVRAAGVTHADAIVGGGAELGSRIAAALLDIPHISHAAGGAKIWWPMIREGVARAASEHGLDGKRVASDDFSAVDIDRTPPSLDTPGYVPGPNLINIRPDFVDFGSDLPAGLDELGASRPLVFVTLGSVFNGYVPLFQLIAQALGDEDVDVLIALGRGIPAAALGELPANVKLAGYVPQNLVVQRASAIVCHGGYSTVVAALAAGVPLYVIPIAADQPYNGERIAIAGAGLSEPPPPGEPAAGPAAFRPPPVEAVRNAVRRLLTDRSFAQGARRVAAEIAALPPAVVAVERVEAEVKNRAGVSV
jgi:UDP:flavonoid glycosyltransferase YjiC (YdhE family)